MRYTHGKAEVPLTVTTETTESPYLCCGYCSAQMALRTAKRGISDRMQNEAHAMRRVAGRPHPAGSNLTELKNGALRVAGVTLDWVSIADIPARLRAGYAIVVQSQYARYPSYLKVQSNDFGHAVCLYGWKAPDLVGFFDPLWHQGTAGAWAKWDEVRPALWNQRHLTTVTKAAPAPAPTPTPTPTPTPSPSPAGADVAISTSGTDLQSGYIVRVKRDTPIYRDSKGTSRIATARRGYTYPYVGIPVGSSRRAALINTAIIYPDNVVRPTVLYLDGADVETVPK
jgi:hypothetical protein